MATLSQNTSTTVCGLNVLIPSFAESVIIDRLMSQPYKVAIAVSYVMSRRIKGEVSEGCWIIKVYHKNASG